MLSLLEVAERTQKGPRLEEKAWDLALFRKMAELARRHEIRCPEDGSWFNLDDSLPERAFQAAVDFLVETGVYCITTGRVVQFAESEVREAITAIPPEVRFGEGRDARVVRQGRLNSQGPLHFRPGHHAPFTEDLAPLVVKNFAMIGNGDYMEGFNFPVVDGREIHGLPIEAYAGRREIGWMRDGVRKAGRPGMAIAYYPISTRAACLIAPMDPEYGLRRTDGILLSVLPDVKVEHDLLTAAIVYEDYGCFKVNGGGSAAVGGFCGGVEGAIIESIVKPLVGWMVYRDSISYAGVGHIGSTTTKQIRPRPELAWGTSVVCQALNRKTSLVYWGGGAGGATSGPGCETFMYETAMGALTVPVNGGHVAGPRQHRAIMNASQTPVEASWCLEVANAALRMGLTREQAPAYLEKFAAKLAGRTPEDGIDIRECWDLVYHRPTPRSRDLYLRVKDELSSWGIDFG